MEEPLCPMSIQNCDSVNHEARWETNTWILIVEKSLLKESDITTMSIPTFWLCSSLSVWNLFCPCLLPRNMTMPTTSARPFQMPEIGLGPHACSHAQQLNLEYPRNCYTKTGSLFNWMLLSLKFKCAISESSCKSMVCVLNYYEDTVARLCSGVQVGAMNL